MKTNNTIIYSSCLISKNTLSKAFSFSREGLGLEVQKYHRLIVDGLVSNGAIVKTVTFQPCICGLDEIQLFENEDGIEYNYLVSKKKHFVHIDIARQSYKMTKEFIKNNKPCYLICDVLNYSVALGSVLAAKKMKVKTIGIITDFPEGSHPKGSIKIPLIWRLIKKCDSYVVLTKQMLEKLNPKKPYSIIEGQADIKTINKLKPQEKYEGFTCLYAGSVHERYGIKNLVDGFLKANIPNSKLIIYGGGDYADKLRAITDERIEYKGIYPNEVVVQEELKVSLLINPRPTDDNYVLYSFPSKTIEYMSTGTPCLSTKLAGIPEEYFDYIYYFDNYDSESIAKKIKEISLLTNEELEEKGKRAKNFVIENKNNVIQAKKIIDLAKK